MSLSSGVGGAQVCWHRADYNLLLDLTEGEVDAQTKTGIAGRSFAQMLV
jgi:hypothetical protein